MFLQWKVSKKDLEMFSDESNEKKINWENFNVAFKRPILGKQYEKVFGWLVNHL